MIKKFFIAVLIFYCFLESKIDVSAAFFNTYASTPGTVIIDTTGTSYTVANYAGNCGGATIACNKGSSSSDCGTGFCSSGSSLCCSGSGNWTKNKSMCVKKTSGYGTYTIGWGVFATQCSLADKQIGSEPGLRAGYCACNSYSGNIYKYCCTAAGNAEQPIMSWSDDDGVYPPEKDCPGGYAIDGNRVRSSPCTVNCTPSCGDTNSQCSGVTYSNGCGSCTGTNEGSCGDTNSQCWGVAYTGSCGKACTGTAISWDSCFNCNEKTYWTMYSDVKNAGVHPGSHYQTNGQYEGRIWQDPYCDGSTLFNCGSATGKNCGDTNGHCSGTTYGSSTGCGTCTGTLGASCGSAGSHCSGEVYGSDSGCGTCTGTLGSSCGDTNAYCSGTLYGSANGCGSCSGTRPAVTGITGRCGGSNGGSFTVASPPTALCNSGTASGVSFSGTTYSWTCAGTAGDCGGANGSTAPCAATRNLPPTFSSIVVKNNVGTVVAAEGGNVNQICQTEFNGVRTVNLTVNATDPNGAGTIGDIQLRWNGINFTRTGLANGVATFNHSFAAGENTTGVTDFQVYISDGVNATGWITAGRSLKVWNCSVPTSGRLYDGGASGSCTVAEDYLTPATATNFKTLDFTDSPTINMGRISESEYNGNLTWGKGYTTIFNTDLAMQISGGGVKTTDVSANTTSCPGIAFTLNNAVLNPYSASPTLRVDFSGVVDQDSWYQTLGGGLLANSKITNRVPVTCTTANCAMSINGTNTINGIVASPTINNTGNSGINKGNPNNWWVTKPLVSTSKSDYTYFLNQYFWKGGVGKTFTGDKNLNDSDIGATGVVFINGNLTINANNSVPVGTFLMMVSNGNITVQSNVTNLEGIFVSKNFNVGGSNATALAVKGMIKATNSLQINRTFVNKRDNNTAPAVNFVYRPDFVFNIPKEIGKQLVKWQWGN